MNISIYGIGNFGYAFLKHLDQKQDKSINLTAYDYKLERVDFLKKNHSHPTLHPNTMLSDDIIFTNSLEELINNCDILLLAIPSTATQEAIEAINKYGHDGIIILNTAKSLEKVTGKRLSESISSKLSVEHQYALLAGGTIAADLFAHEPLGADIACADNEALKILTETFQSPTLTINPTHDLVGVEYASALKNIVSIFAGIVHGMGLSYGAETHAISKLAQQISTVCINDLGADQSTFTIGSQCWGNDMWMSCTGNTRNREFGKLLGSGMSVEDSLNTMKKQDKLIEGVNTLKVLKCIKPLYALQPVRILVDVICDGRQVSDIQKYIQDPST